MGSTLQRKKRRDDWAAEVSASNTLNAVAEAFIAKCERDGLAANTIVKRHLFTKPPIRRNP